MKSIYRCVVSLAAVAAAGLFASAMPAQAQCHGITCAAPARLGVQFSVFGLSAPGMPAVDRTFIPLEHTGAAVHFALTVSKGGIVGTPAPVSGYVCAVAHENDDCPRNGFTASFSNLQDGQTVLGTATWTAPASIEVATGYIRFCQTQPALPSNGTTCQSTADGVFYTPVSARYVISIQDYTILHTRAIHNDTVAITLLGGVFGSKNDTVVSCGLTPTQSCVRGALEGDHNNGTYFVNNVSVGPFTLVPGQEGGLFFAYVVFNFGAGYGSDANYNAMNAQLSNILLQSFGNADGDNNPQPDTSYADQANGLGWHGLDWHGCDGPTAFQTWSVSDAKDASGNTGDLRAQTNATGKTVRQMTGYTFTSQAGCGESPRYSVEWVVTRTSWAPG